MDRIPLVDLHAQHTEIEHELNGRLRTLFSRGNFILGDEVAEFETAFADYSGGGHCIGVANGTDAVELALRALGIGPGDEVILPANTFIATALAVVRAGATPVLVDCDAKYSLMDLAQTAAAITDRTRAILPVHLFGQVAPLSALSTLAKARGVHIVADAAQAQGARHNGAGVASLAPTSATSFYPGKNLGAYGDAGAVLTTSDATASALRALRNYGSDAKYYHPRTGFNSRLDTLQAIVLLEKLKRLESWNERRRRAAERYDAMLGDIGTLTLPATAPGNLHVFHLYVVRLADRDAVLRDLHSQGIAAGVHYPVPIHLQGAFSYLGHKTGAFPEAETQAETMLSLPIYPHITEEQQSRVVEALRRAVRS